MPRPRRCQIHYRDVRKHRWKYRLDDAYHEHVTALKTGARVSDEDNFVVLEPEGLIRLARGYAWDGPSGPTIDTPNFMRGSLVHDGLYQLMRIGELDHEVWRLAADEELRKICLADGMQAWRANMVFRFVRLGGVRRATTRLTSRRMCAP